MLKQDGKHLLGRLLDPPDAAEVDRVNGENHGVPRVSDMSGDASAGSSPGGLQTLGDTCGFRASMSVVVSFTETSH